jgi:NAD-specific glutamate dehydrogenase
MAAMYKEQTPEEMYEGDFNLGFNGGPVIINEDVLNKLEKAIDSNYQDYIATDGFFWGQQYQEEQVNNYKKMDKKFLQWCKKQVSKGNIPEYHCSW